MSLYRDGTIKQGRIRGSLRAIILDPVVVVGVYIYMYSLGKGISRSARARLCVRAPAQSGKVTQAGRRVQESLAAICV